MGLFFFYETIRVSRLPVSIHPVGFNFFRVVRIEIRWTDSILTVAIGLDLSIVYRVKLGFWPRTIVVILSFLFLWEH